MIGISSAQTGLKPAKYSALPSSKNPGLNTFEASSNILSQPSVLNL